MSALENQRKYALRQDRRAGRCRYCNQDVYGHHFPSGKFRPKEHPVRKRTSGPICEGSMKLQNTVRQPKDDLLGLERDVEEDLRRLRTNKYRGLVG